MQVVLGLHLQSGQVVGIVTTAAGVGARRFVFPATIVWPQSGAPRFTDDSDSDDAFHGYLDRLDDPVPMHNLAGAARSRTELCCTTISLAIAEVERSTGDEVVRTVVALPANWSPTQVTTFRRALTRHPHARPVSLVPETDAALRRIEQLPQTAGADSVLVIDVGSGSTTLMCASRPAGADGFTPEAIAVLDGRGTAEVDHAFFTQVLGSLDDDTRRAVQLAALRTDCTAAREILCSNVNAAIPLTLRSPSGTIRRSVRVVRAEIEELTQPWVSAMVDALDRHAHDGGRRPTHVVLIGAASSVPLLVEKVSSHFRVPVIVPDSPDSVCASGAAAVAARDCVVRLPIPPRTPAPSRVPAPVYDAAAVPARPTPVRPAPGCPAHPAAPGGWIAAERTAAPATTEKPRSRRSAPDTPPGSTSVPSHPPLQRRRWPVLAGAAALVVLAGGAALGLVSVDSTSSHYSHTAHVSREIDSGSITPPAGGHADPN